MSRHSKIDQVGNGKWVKLNRFLGSNLCSVEAVDRFLDVRVKGGNVFLVHEDSSHSTKFQFNAVLKSGLPCLSNFLVSAHS